MAWELDSTFIGRYRTELEYALGKWTDERLAEALANDDYERSGRWEQWVNRTPQWWRRSKTWFDGRKGFYLKFCAKDTLIDTVIERIERTATTDNGAWAIWIDKDGCSKVKSEELGACDANDAYETETETQQ